MESNRQEQVSALIDKLRAEYENDKFSFEFRMAMMISGNSKRGLRQDIAEYITGVKQPLSKCGLHGIVDMLVNRFNQCSLF